ncbi:chromosome segregation protein SMC [Wenzhouxiangella sp. AB-CW3]|uniref:chromosome segregation protein SMC n=1 Tax=Wenzhouxiangella sp. AB-CW3 TaxID=2771012 RepID=UPI00168BB991|nr:chromosome segregation protein SMC [Wenzhouxiangella sp. AB-CW3]QOC23976.1 chromosome segregation protein SMC [Wenzhouxiangella sp. AB-CW3]
MRLTAIKLSGFKSFVEPTTIKFPSNLMGVVGPNGCGKSNIIDAVRWVMGESSARQLRGESMSDVIFSGSSARKPVATATVELVFDNSDGRAGGEYADYNEISVKRQVSRDGQSAYYLNGTKCRRKDITNLFLGTGLGPRSYAIIEQGMISQIVEARPEELRGFLEEAAGISRYKERRRETENRIRHTRENLERLADLREEVSKHLDKLKRQANAAERYRKLKARYRQDEARLLALRWREYRSRATQEEQVLREVENKLQQTLARQREAEKELESLRQQQHGASDAVSKVQGELYEVAGEIARIEQSIEHQREIRKRQQAEHADTESQLNELKQHLVLDKAQVKETSELLARLSPELEQAREEESSAAAEVERIEQQLAQWQERWQAHQEQASKTASTTELLRQRIEHIDERMNRAAERLKTLDDDSGTALIERLESEHAEANEKLAVTDESMTREKEQSDAQQAEISELRRRIEALRNDLEAARAARHERQARIESLRLLNQDGDQAEVLESWLKDHDIDPESRIMSRLKLRDTRWTRAVETVLSAWLQAVQVDEIGSDLLEKLPPAGLFLAEKRSVSPSPGSLGEQVEGAGVLASVLGRVFLAEHPDEARRKLESLQADESVVTPEGLWLGQGWLRQPEAAESGSSLLEREQEIRDLSAAVEEDDHRIAEIEQALSQARESLERAERALSETARRSEQLQRARGQFHGQVSALASRLESARRQRQAAAQERETLVQRQQEDGEAVTQARQELEQAMAGMEAAQQEREPLVSEKTRLDEQRNLLRQRRREVAEKREALSLKVESSRAGLESLRQSIERMDSQVGQLQSRYLELSEALAEGDAPVREQEEKRDQLLERRLEVEKRLRKARQELEALETEWRRQDDIRQSASAGADEIRSEQSRRQLELKETQLKADGVASRIEELDADLDQLLGELPEGAAAEKYQQELEALEQKIRKLEPVNLAAIEEYDAESERKEYLDRQHADLEDALETLEKAIARIDRDTRTRFRETFEQVNRNMEQLFPRLFGGGHGHLEMVGDDWLSAGVAIMARPPGKRIARIHLLSGGEKALTAVSFVFSIFNLNPAPFCLLDEVDAPLDDANVGRFSDMVREMSEQVQFVMVTHNKVTMEVAHQMLGVTMREPGVSRLVSVDLDRAVEMAQA